MTIVLEPLFTGVQPIQLNSETIRLGRGHESLQVLTDIHCSRKQCEIKNFYIYIVLIPLGKNVMKMKKRDDNKYQILKRGESYILNDGDEFTLLNSYYPFRVTLTSSSSSSSSNSSTTHLNSSSNSNTSQISSLSSTSNYSTNLSPPSLSSPYSSVELVTQYHDWKKKGIFHPSIFRNLENLLLDDGCESCDQFRKSFQKNNHCYIDQKTHTENSETYSRNLQNDGNHNHQAQLSHINSHSEDSEKHVNQENQVNQASHINSATKRKLNTTDESENNIIKRQFVSSSEKKIK